VIINGERFDVTDDIAAAVIKHQITFSKKEDAAGICRRDESECRKSKPKTSRSSMPRPISCFAPFSVIWATEKG
jgi:hypothetical protein